MSDVDSVLADEALTCVLIVADSPVHDEVVQGLVARSVSVARVVLVAESSCESDELDRILAEARVGWRFVIAGMEAAVGRIRSQILEAGAVDSEVSVVSTEGTNIGSTRRRDVFCAHCHAITSAVTAVDGVVECRCCSAELTVYYHYSRRHGAYLGYRADSEDL